MISITQKAFPVAALSKSLAISCMLVASMSIHAESIDQTFTRLREMSDSRRIAEFHKLDIDSKKHLFFIANAKHPPYSGLDSAMIHEGSPFLLQLRADLQKKGGTPEVLSFLGIAMEEKRHGSLMPEDIDQMDLGNVCALAPKSNYCPTLLGELLGKGTNSQ